MDTLQGSIFDLLDNAKSKDYGSEDLRRIDAEIRSALIRDQRESGLSRDQVVDKMQVLGAEITIHTYNNFLNESHKHRFPLAWVIHHVLATGERSVLELIAEVIGCRVQEEDDVIFEEMGKIQHLEQELRLRKRDLAKRVRPLFES